MAKMRVYDLAKELGIESKQIIETLCSESSFQQYR